MGKILVVMGITLVALGNFFWLLEGRTGWFGRLPGDVRIEKPRFRFYFPFTTMLLLSVILTLALWAYRRIFRSSGYGFPETTFPDQDLPSAPRNSKR